MDSGLRIALLKLVAKMIDTGLVVADPSSADTLAAIQSIIDSDDTMKSKLFIMKDGATAEVALDTTNPYAHTPIPVVITDVTGSAVVTINAGDISVNIRHDGLDPSSVRIGDGTTLMSVNTNGSINVKPVQVDLGQYKFLDEAVDSVDSTINYYGFADITGRWYIMKENTVNKTVRYINGVDSVSPYDGTGNAWDNRESHGYTYLYDLIWM